MKSILITSLKWAFLGLGLRQNQSGERDRRSGIRMAGAKTACLLLASIASISAQAGTIGITYSFAGVGTGPPVVTGTTLTANSAGTGSILSSNPGLNALWNPITFQDQLVVDLTTGLGNGSFSISFASGDMLFANLFEDVSALVATGGTGPFTQTLTFTGGTGMFAGASGSASGGGLAGTTGFTASGSGTLTAPAIVPEPASVALICGGLLVMVASRKRVRRLTVSETQRSFRAGEPRP